MDERLALFGGTFNPVHRGHIEVARAALAELQLGELWLVPSAVPPHKAAVDLAPAADRLAMCRLAARDEQRIKVSDVEALTAGPSYTVYTLRRFAGERPRAQIMLLMGADMLRDFHLWRRFKEIAGLARVVTLPRPGFEIGPLAELRAALGEVVVERILGDVLHTPLVDASSTEIRRRVKAGEPLDDLVPAAVAKYIGEHGLYV